MAHIRINPVSVNSKPSSGRELIRGTPCKYSLRLFEGETVEQRHLGDFDTYFEALVFATNYAQEHSMRIKDYTYPAQRQ